MSSGYIRITAALAILLCFAMQLQAQSPLIIEKVIARVGTENIFYSELQELYQYAKAQDPSYDGSLQCDIMEQLISKKMLIDQAKIDSIYVSAPEVEAEVGRRIEYILQQMGGDEERFYKFYGQTPKDKAEAMKGPMEEDLIQQRIQGSLIKDIEITPSEVVAFFDQIPADSLPFLPAEVEIAEITTKTNISESVMTAAKDKLEGIRSRIVDDGESFQELASLFSDDPGSGANGGDLGWAKRGSYVPEFEAVAFNLEIGEISELVETQFGYHVLELLERRGNNIHLRHILVKPEVTPEDIAATKSLLDSVKNMVVNDSLPFEIAVTRYSDDDAQSYSNAGRLINPKTGDTFWETGQLPYQIYFAIEGVDVGDVSTIVEMEERGEKVFKLIQLKTRTKPHRASLETDFAKIKQYAKESKKNVYFNDWMENKIQATYVDIIEAFNGCPNLTEYFDASMKP